MSNQTEQEIGVLVKRAEIGRRILMETAIEPHRRKERPTFTGNRAAAMLGLTRSRVQSAFRSYQEELGGASKGREIDEAFLRRLTPDAPRTGPGRVVAVANQKGGVGKTTTAVHLAQYFALTGYKVVAIDLDPQASFSHFMGLNPDLEIEDDDTVIPLLIGSRHDLAAQVVKAPHFDRLSYVPSSLGLAWANEEMARRQERNLKCDDGTPYLFWDRLRTGVDPLRNDFDLIILDTPPHVAPVTYNALCCADSIIVPTGGSGIDLASTLRFIDWINETNEIFKKVTRTSQLHFEKLRFLVTGMDHYQASIEGLAQVQAVMGGYVLRSILPRSSEVYRAAQVYKTIYELRQPIASRTHWSAACEAFDAIGREVRDSVFGVKKGGVA
ncbi:ParA family protein (plasmid) [Flagellatimonas centrodinii]|uniref:ParA family protein n=1 Tax=Flagellatimonas centrodinii TaxID=2806210 RepID=UPI001FEE4CD3|nr:AAA family ATPase [Flagellatimonas centrodinii]ULQ48416.1 ParA family protein [Flagellatimonas centrodinii]